MLCFKEYQRTGLLSSQCQRRWPVNYCLGIGPAASDLLTTLLLVAKPTFFFFFFSSEKERLVGGGKQRQGRYAYSRQRLQRSLQCITLQVLRLACAKSDHPLSLSPFQCSSPFCHVSFFHSFFCPEYALQTIPFFF